MKEISHITNLRGIDHVYIPHYHKLVQRKAHLLSEFKKYGIGGVEFRTYFPRESVSKEMVSRFYNKSRPGTNYKMELVEIVNYIEQYYIVIDMLKRGYNACLILEDDAILVNGFRDIFNKYMETIPDDWEVTFLHDGCFWHADGIEEGKYWYSANKSRTCCSYMLTQEACRKIVHLMFPCYLPIDHTYEALIKTQKLKCYWCEPVIVREGSIIGIYNTSADNVVRK
jgi:hypothetical protein